MQVTNPPNSPIDHAKAGLLHQVQQVRKHMADIQQKLVTVNKEIAAVLSDFRRLADIHEIWDRELPNYEVFTRRHDGQLDKAKQYLTGSIASAILAVVFGVYFSLKTLNAQSPWVLLLGATAVAIVLEVIFAFSLRAVLGANPENPKAIKRVNVAVGMFSALLLGSISTFAYLRFKADSADTVKLSVIIVCLELFSLLLAGAAECGYRIYRWSGVSDRKFHSLDSQRHRLESELADANVRLQELEYRLNQMQSRGVASTEEKKYESNENVTATHRS